jgi:dihydrofolate reductase
MLADHHRAITFLPGGLSDAVATAAAAAAGKDVIVFGANLAVQCLRAGLLDEIVIHLVPVLLGGGVHLMLADTARLVAFLASD